VWIVFPAFSLRLLSVCFFVANITELTDFLSLIPSFFVVVSAVVKTRHVCYGDMGFD